MADRGPLSVTIREQGGAVVVTVGGEIGYHEAPSLRASIKEAYEKKPRRLVADLSGVTYMATPGLATLVEALQIAKRTQTVLVLCGLTERVRAIFEIARLHTVFKIVGTVDEAVVA